MSGVDVQVHVDVLARELGRPQRVHQLANRRDVLIEVFGGRKGSKAFGLIALSNGWADHYSAAAIYLRLNGLLPPTAQPNKK